MRRFKNILVAAALALAIVAASAAHAGTQTSPVSKCDDFACEH